MKNPSKRRRRGQGMTEYIILVGVIAILIITSVEAFKNKLAETFGKSTTSIDTHITSRIDAAAK
jgi:Flp pilus assembly pilin Flp